MAPCINEVSGIASRWSTHPTCASRIRQAVSTTEASARTSIDLSDTGFFGVNGALHSPNGISGDWFYLINLVHDDKNYRQQIAITYDVGIMDPSRIFLRTDLVGTWNPWVELASVQMVTAAIAPIISRLDSLEARVTALEG